MSTIKLCLALSILSLSGVAVAESTTAQVAETASSSSTSTYDWTGVYVGGFVGGASGANTTSSSSTSTTNRFEPIFDSVSSTSTNSSTSASFIGGGTVGYNWQIPKTPYLIGLEGEYGYLGQSGSSQSQTLQDGFFGTNTNRQNKTTIGSDYGYGLVGGRIGYALDRSLFYVKSGAVFTQVKSTNSTNSQSQFIPENNTAASSKSGGTTTGYAIGGGVEFAPQWYSNQNITVKVEYLYFGIPTTNDNQTSTAQGFSIFQNTTDTNNHNSTGGIHTAKIGVNYKF